MPTFYTFKIPKNSPNPIYIGWVIKWGWFKWERIGCKNKFMWRWEISNWGE